MSFHCVLYLCGLVIVNRVGVLYGSHCNNIESVLGRSRKCVWQLEHHSGWKWYLRLWGQELQVFDLLSCLMIWKITLRQLSAACFVRCFLGGDDAVVVVIVKIKKGICHELLTTHSASLRNVEIAVLLFL